MTPCSAFGLKAALLSVFLYPDLARADKLQITSAPPGATVEIDGVAVGTTPSRKTFLAAIFTRHAPH
jgi:hypothetical protein